MKEQARTEIHWFCNQLYQGLAPVSAVLHQCDIQDGDLSELVAAISQAKQPFSLDLSRNHVGQQGFSDLMRACFTAQVPISLNLSDNRINDAHMASLADCPHWHAPVILDLSHNQITDVGVQTLVGLFKDTPHRFTLILRGNAISDQGAILLSELFVLPRPSTTLDLSLNALNHAFVDSFVANIGNYPHAVGLGLESVALNTDDIQKFSTLIEHAKAPIFLDVDENNLDEEAAQSLVQSAIKSTQPIYLDIGNNDISEEMIHQLLSLFPQALNPLSVFFDEVVVVDSIPQNHTMFDNSIHMHQRLIAKHVGGLFPTTIAHLISEYASGDIAPVDQGLLRNPALVAHPLEMQFLSQSGFVLFSETKENAAESQDLPLKKIKPQPGL